MASAVPVTELIVRKRDGGELRREEILDLIAAYLADEVDDAQMAALLMAGVIRGFTTDEAVALTEALVASGDTIDLSALAGPTVDKHSTGGVGDGTSLVVGPLLAAAGCQLAKLSGRGLGHTGGTLDKLDSIPGFRVDLTPEQLEAQVQTVGLAIAAATAELVPADKRLYALRDVTGTVASPALIASSVMSKKLAGGAAHVLLDVKVGDGAFLPDPASAVDLAQLCVSIGESHGRRTAALVTDMSQPLADGIGNALEVAVAVDTLQGRRGGRFRELCLELSAGALQLTGVQAAAARTQVEELLDAGAALDRFRAFVAAQGGDPTVADDPWQVLPAAPVIGDWTPGDGVVSAIACRRIGELAGRLGAGRRRQGDRIDPAVGLELLVRVGDRVDDGQPAARVHARTEDDLAMARAALAELVELGDAPVDPPPLVHDRVGLE